MNPHDRLLVGPSVINFGASLEGTLSKFMGEIEDFKNMRGLSNVSTYRIKHQTEV